MKLFYPTRIRLSIGLLNAMLLGACQPQAVSLRDEPPATPDFKPVAATLHLPTTVDYHDNGGALAAQVYRATLTYDAQHRLVAIRDQLVNATSVNAPWAEFRYTGNRLTRIDLRAVSVNYDAPNYQEEQQPARFELTYAGPQVNALLLIGGNVVQETTFSLDERGLPIRSTLKRLSFDRNGNVDWITDSKRYPVNGTEVIAQRYDSRPTVFGQVREMQLLDALLGTTNRRTPASGLGGLHSSLNTNNLVSTKRKNCDPKHGCHEFDVAHTEVTSVDAQGHPTQLIAHLGALGPYRFTVTYQQVDGQ